MAQNFGKIRNVALSTVFYLQSAFTSGWSGVTVVKGEPNFPVDSLPVVAVSVDSIFPRLKEVGSRATDNNFNVIIDIYATSGAQREDLAQFVEDKILLDWVYYIFSTNESDRENPTKAANGRLKWQSFTQHIKVNFLENVAKFDRFRHRIAFNVRIAENV